MQWIILIDDVNKKVENKEINYLCIVGKIKIDTYCQIRKEANNPTASKHRTLYILPQIKERVELQAQ